MKGIYDKSSSILTEEESSRTGNHTESPDNKKKNLEPWRAGQRKGIVINARLSEGSKSKD